MSVNKCHRNGCTSILCDTYVDSIGYVCYNCQKEFQMTMGPLVVLGEMTEDHIESCLGSFMNIKKKEVYGHYDEQIKNFFAKHTFVHEVR